MNVNYHKVR